MDLPCELIWQKLISSLNSVCECRLDKELGMGIERQKSALQALLSYETRIKVGYCI